MDSDALRAADRTLAFAWAALGRNGGFPVVAGPSMTMFASGTPFEFFNGAIATAPASDPDGAVRELLAFFASKDVPYVLSVRDGTDDALLAAGRAAGLGRRWRLATAGAEPDHRRRRHRPRFSMLRSQPRTPTCRRTATWSWLAWACGSMSRSACTATVASTTLTSRSSLVVWTPSLSRPPCSYLRRDSWRLQRGDASRAPRQGLRRGRDVGGRRRGGSTRVHPRRAPTQRVRLPRLPPHGIRQRRPLRGARRTTPSLIGHRSVRPIELAPHGQHPENDVRARAHATVATLSAR